MIIERRLSLTVTLLLCVILTSSLFAGEANKSADDLLPKGLQGLSVGGVYYLNFQYSQEKGEDFSDFFIHRAYLTVKKEILPFLHSRITLDTNQDGEGDGEGDMEVRIKYAYADFKLNDMGFITKPHIELGMVHGPWFDFEEHINYYRMRDKMFAERSHIFNSADFGFTAAGYFGGEVNNEYKKTVNKKYPGKYGSFAFGVYNGGGYHGVEVNRNKVVEGRVTVRPLPEKLTGLQFSLFGVYGKGNKAGEYVDDIPDWNLMLGMISYEHRLFTLTGQYLSGQGNQKGAWVKNDDHSESHDVEGYSFFTEVKPDKNWRIIGGYDSFDGYKVSKADVEGDPDIISELNHTLYYAGVGYDFGNRNILIFDYNLKDYDVDGVDNDYWYQLTMQVHF